MNELGDMAAAQRPLHALNRLGFGPRPGDVAAVAASGTNAYIAQQLHPQSIAVPDSLRQRIASYRTLHMSPGALFYEYQLPIIQTQRAYRDDKDALQRALPELRKKGRVVYLEASDARLLRAIEGPRQLQEVMTAFWFNHFNVFVGKGFDRFWIGSFEQDAIRPNTLGRFRTLLGATAKHPAMLFYLDNWENTQPDSPGAKNRFEGINENYARELMELHTLGVDGGYTQQDVIALAHILTGWGLPNGRGNFNNGGEARRRPFSGLDLDRHLHFGAMPAGDQPFTSANFFFFDADRHDFSTKVLLGETIDGGGIAEGERALDLLAQHPSTAKHLSYQLAQYFVADDPPKALVARMAERYLQTDGHIGAMLETMFNSHEFWAREYYASKFKTPYEYVISAARASGAPVTNFRPLYGTMALLGMPLYGCQTPNGYSNTRDAWLNPDAMMARLSFATALSRGNLPLEHPPFLEDDAMAAGGDAEPKPPPVPTAKNPDAGAKSVRFDYLANRAPAVPKMTPPDPQQVAMTLGNNFSIDTRAAVEAANPDLRSALLLGSPEFMKR